MSEIISILIDLVEADKTERERERKTYWNVERFIRWKFGASASPISPIRQPLLTHLFELAVTYLFISCRRAHRRSGTV